MTHIHTYIWVMSFVTLVWSFVTNDMTHDITHICSCEVRVANVHELCHLWLTHIYESCHELCHLSQMTYICVSHNDITRSHLRHALRKNTLGTHVVIWTQEIRPCESIQVLLTCTYVCVCVSVCVRECVCIYKFTGARTSAYRKGARKSWREREKERERACMCVCLCVCLCVCVCERESVCRYVYIYLLSLVPQTIERSSKERQSDRKREREVKSERESVCVCNVCVCVCVCVFESETVCVYV